MAEKEQKLSNTECFSLILLKEGFPLSKEKAGICF